MSVQLPTVINCKVQYLRPRGYDNFEAWATAPGNVYIGRDMSRFVKGAQGSKWGNPFKESSGMSLDDRVSKYEEYVRSNPELLAALPELLQAKEIGCWCCPSPCHGFVLVKLLSELLNHSGVEPMPSKIDSEKTTVAEERAATAEHKEAAATAVRVNKKKNRLQ